MSAASVDCSGTSTGGDQRLGFVFQNLNASGMHLGWTCVIRGCYKLERTLGNDIWVRTPSTTFTLGSGDCGMCMCITNLDNRREFAHNVHILYECIGKL